MRSWPYLLYVISNDINSTVYVGVTKKKLKHRWQVHVANALRGADLRFASAIRKHGPDNFSPVEVARANTELNAFAMEQALIKQYRDAGVKLYNMNDGGKGILNADARTREKISKAIKGKPKSEEAKKNLSEAVKRLWREDAEYRANVHSSRLDPESAVKRSAGALKSWLDPEKRANRVSAIQRAMTPELKKQRSTSHKNRWETLSDDEKKKHSIRVSAALSGEGAAKISAGQKKSWADPEIRESRIAKLKAAIAAKKLVKEIQ